MVVQTAGRVVRGAEINNIRFLSLRRHRKKAIFHIGIHKYDLSACHHVRIHVNRVYRIRDQDRVVRIKEIEDISDITLRAVADEYILRRHLNLEGRIILLNCFAQEIISLLRTISMERSRLALLHSCFRKCVSCFLADWKGYVTDTHFDHLCLWMCFGILIYFFSDGRKQIAFFQIFIVFVDLHTLLSPYFKNFFP